MPSNLRSPLVLFSLLVVAACSGQTGEPASRPGHRPRAGSSLTAAPPESSAHPLPVFRRATPGKGTVDAGPLHPPAGGHQVHARWTPVATPAPLFAGTALLLTDGSVMVQDAGGPDWYKLTPDQSGSYVNGAWVPLAPMPDGYAPLYFASAVLPDGRVIIEGGEYLAGDPAWTTLGAIYDPVKDSWTKIAPPSGWDYIGDAQSIVLPDGRFLLASCCSQDAAILDPKTLTWTPFGSGKADVFDEEGWTLLQNGQLLTVDTNFAPDPLHAELFNPATGLWSAATSTPVALVDPASLEMGPQMVRPDGTVFAAGATGHTAVYHPGTNQWTRGPDFPVVPEGQLDVADGPAALLPNGHVMVVASPGVYQSGVHFFDFDGTSLTEIGAPPAAVHDSSYYVNLLVLPSGEILATDFSTDVEIYSSDAPPDRSHAPRLTRHPEEVTLGRSYRISGTQLSGLSQAVAYGDDAQGATNYPLVRVTSLRTGHVRYLRTHDQDSSSIAPGARSSTTFDVPADLETGESTFEVVANGIASPRYELEVQAPEDESEHE